MSAAASSYPAQPPDSRRPCAGGRPRRTVSVVSEDLFAELLVNARLITPRRLRIARRAQLELGGGLDYSLVMLGFVRRESLLELLARRFRISIVDPAELALAPALAALVPRGVAERRRLVPLACDGRVLTVAMADPTDLAAIDDVEKLARRRVEPTVASEWRILEAIEGLYGPRDPSGGRGAAEAPAVDLASFPLDEALRHLVPRYTAEWHRVLPLSRDGASCVVAMADPTSRRALDELAFLIGPGVVPAFAPKTALLAAIERLYGRPDPSRYAVPESEGEELVSANELAERARLRRG